MDPNPAFPKLLLLGVPPEWQGAISTSLENARFVPQFSMSKEDAAKMIQSGNLSAVIITSDFVFDNDLNQDVISLTYGKIPTLTIIFEETFRDLGQEKVFGKVYNPETFQEFCTVPFDMDELLLRLRKIIHKSKQQI